jgi:hypothetical protein
MFPIRVEEAMVDKRDLRDKHVLLKISSSPGVFGATVIFIEENGFWFSIPTLFAEVAKKPDFADLKKPVFFVPTSHVEWLIASDEESA